MSDDATTNGEAEAAAEGPPPETSAELATSAASTWRLAEPVTATLIRRGFNEHWQIEAGDGTRWALRLYLPGKYYVEGDGEADFRFELALLDHLSAEGVPVAAPAPTASGDLLARIPGADGEPRWAALLSWAAGAPFHQIRGDETAAAAASRALGDAVGRLHLAADRFSPPPGARRYELGVRYLLDEPIRHLEALLAEHGRPGLDRFSRLFDRLRSTAEALPRDGGAWGFVHGDLHGGNVNVEPPAGVTIFDFDHGGFGWRAYDLATVAMGTEGDAWDAFLDGYSAHRRPASEELAALPTLQALRELWDVGDVLAMRPAFRARYGPAPEGQREREAAWLDRITEHMELGAERFAAAT